MSFNSIEDILAVLTLKSSYWSMVISKFNKKEHNEDTFIVGIEFNGDDVIFLYNFNSLKNMTIQNIDAVLEHEVGHILNNHYIRAINIQLEKQEHLLNAWNTATDMALNCNIKNMPHSFWCGWNFEPIFPNSEGFEDGLLAEDYFEQLKDKYKLDEKSPKNNQSNEENDDNKQENGNKQNSGSNDSDSSGDNSDNKKNEEADNQNGSSGENSNDDGNIEKYGKSGISQNNHDHWKSEGKITVDPNSSYIAENLFRKIIEDTTKEYTESFGNLPGDLQVKIDKFLAPPKLPYYSIIKKLVVGSRLGKQKISYSKLNRKRMYVFTKEDELGMKFMPPFPGKTNDKSFKIGVLLDTSASVPITDDGIYEALNGLESILKEDQNAEIILLQVDTEIREEKKLKSIKDIHRIEVKGRGGTRLLPGLNRLKELKVDVSLVFTDGYFEDICQYVYSLPKKIVWILPDKKSTDYRIGNIGHIIHFPVKE